MIKKFNKAIIFTLIFSCILTSFFPLVLSTDIQLEGGKYISSAYECNSGQSLYNNSNNKPTKFSLKENIYYLKKPSLQSKAVFFKETFERFSICKNSNCKYAPSGNIYLLL